jgi:hypothetical protein
LGSELKDELRPGGVDGGQLAGLKYYAGLWRKV